MKAKYLSKDQIYKMDKITTEKFLIPSIILMENAGRFVADFTEILAKKMDFKKISIFCGPGKNGGDGFVACRHLFLKNFDTKVILLTDSIKFNEDTLLNYRILERLGVKIDFYREEYIRKTDVIIDAIFGIGLNKEITGVYANIIKKINDSKKMVIAVDIPSGLDADTGKIYGISVKANYTITMGFLKLAFKRKKAKQFTGSVIRANIGYPKML